jgi:hypothetical protein
VEIHLVNWTAQLDCNSVNHLQGRSPQDVDLRGMAARAWGLPIDLGASVRDVDSGAKLRKMADRRHVGGGQTLC